MNSLVVISRSPADNLFPSSHWVENKNDLESLIVTLVSFRNNQYLVYAVVLFLILFSFDNQ